MLLIHHFPLPLLFRNHRYLPVAIRGYHLQTVLTLPWHHYTSFLPFPSFSLIHRPHLSFPSLPTPPIYAYNMPLHLLCRPALHYIHLYRLCYPSNATLQISMLRNVDTEDEENRRDSHVHANVRQIWRTIDVEQCGFKPCRCQAYITTPTCNPATLFLQPRQST